MAEEGRGYRAHRRPGVGHDHLRHIEVQHMVDQQCSCTRRDGCAGEGMPIAVQPAQAAEQHTWLDEPRVVHDSRDQTVAVAAHVCIEQRCLGGQLTEHPWHVGHPAEQPVSPGLGVICSS